MYETDSIEKDTTTGCGTLIQLLNFLQMSLFLSSSESKIPNARRNSQGSESLRNMDDKNVLHDLGSLICQPGWPFIYLPVVFEWYLISMLPISMGSSMTTWDPISTVTVSSVVSTTTEFISLF